MIAPTATASPALDLGPLQELMDDPEVTEIMVNGPDKVFIERGGRKALSHVRFADDGALRALTERIFASRSKRVGHDVPYADACLEDGTRVNAILPPLARFGLALTLRKFARGIRTIDDLIANGTLTAKAAQFLRGCIRGKINLLFSGGTGTGKTTLLQLLSHDFDAAERVITIEDAAELRIARDNVISLETRAPEPDGRGEITLRDLIRNSLRMTPDRLVIGEVRGAEAIDLLQAMETGHSGTLGVIHGNSPRESVSRLETMVLMSGLSLPLAEVRKIIATTIPLIVHLARMPGGARRVTAITELRGLHEGEIVFNDLMLLPDASSDADPGPLQTVLRSYPLFLPRLQRHGLLPDDILRDELNPLD